METVSHKIENSVVKNGSNSVKKTYKNITDYLIAHSIKNQKPGSNVAEEYKSEKPIKQNKTKKQKVKKFLNQNLKKHSKIL